MIPHVERPGARKKDFGRDAFGHDNFMGVEGDVHLGDFAIFNAPDRMIVGQSLGWGQNRIGAVMYFYAPEIQHPAVLR